MMKKDKGQFVKKFIKTDYGKIINPKWVKIHWGTKQPKESIECGNNFPKNLNEVL